MPVTSSTTDVYSDLGLRAANNTETGPKKQLGQDDFLALLTTQLRFQDPLKPVDNQEFIAQMAQFSSLDSLQNLQKGFDALATALTSNQALQASSMVGRSVLVQSDEGFLPTDGMISGNVELDSNVDRVKIEIRDASGALVANYDLGGQPQGPLNFNWDGSTNDGTKLPSGNYTIAVFSTVANKTEQLPTNIRARVSSVNMSSNNGEIVLNLQGLGSVLLSDVKEIGG